MSTREMKCVIRIKGLQVPNVPSGLIVGDGAGGNLVGGILPGASNTIAHNFGCGVVVDLGTANALLSNRIFSNIGPGIDLGKDFGPTLNDPGDTDEGANHLQNFPCVLRFPENCRMLIWTRIRMLMAVI